MPNARPGLALRTDFGAQSALPPPREARGCLACGSTDASVLCDAPALAQQQAERISFHRRRLHDRPRQCMQERTSFTHDYATDIVECGECGLLYRTQQPTPAATRAEYEDETYPQERTDDLIASQTALYQPKAEALRHRLGSGARVIEVGSYVGGFLTAARNVGLDAAGLDPSRQLAADARRRGLRVARTTLEELVAEGALPRAIDGVFVWNTFDQLPDPSGLLAAAAQVLKPGGLLVLRVPHGRAFSSGCARLREGGRRTRTLALRALAWNNLLGFPYLYGHTLRSLDRATARHGFLRSEARGDVLGRFTGPDYGLSARVEERLVKGMQRMRIAQQSREPSSELEAAPWLDVEYVLRPDPVAARSAPDVGRESRL